MPDLETLLASLVVAVLVVLVATNLVKQVTVYEFQRGLRYRNGRYVGLVGPGRHWLIGGGTHIRLVDVRAGIVAIVGQELVTSDGVTVKISLVADRLIVDPEAAINRVEDHQAAMHSAIQVALREIVGGLTIDDVLARRGEIGRLVLERAVQPVRALGIELRSVDVRDLMLPGPTKRLLSQVVEARQRGLASLEKARGETAALRSLANAARMVEANPALLQLRLLHQLESTTGNTVLFGTPQPTPLPGRQVSGPDESATTTKP